MGKKKFIDKKNSQHFYVVRRSQRDPRIADEDSSPFVLVPARTNVFYFNFFFFFFLANELIHDGLKNCLESIKSSSRING